MFNSDNQRNHTKHVLGLTLTLAALMTVTVLVSGPVALAQVTTPGWSYTGNLNTVRFGHTATVLPNGKVLVAGGIDWSDVTVTNTAELYDPATEKWSLTGSLNVPRYLFTATLLSNGKVLVAGGSVTGVTDTNTAELYDPTTGAWSLTGNLNSTRFWHSATLLRNGKVLIVGGSDESSLLNTAELYEPETGAWSVTGSLNACCGRFSHTATLLQNGKVLVAGGTDDGDFGPSLNLISTELYDPNTGAWSVTGSLHTGRMRHTATVLPNGNVLAAGGMDFPCPGGFCYSTVNDTAELYNPATGTWSYTGRLSRRSDHTATVLPNGQILVAGGGNIAFDNNFQGGSLNSAELYDPTTGTWSPTANLNTARFFHTATLLSNGKVLVVGGSYGPLRSTELYDAGADAIFNPIDDAQFFVRQHYLDFLSRDPDAGGLAYWTNEITKCGTDARCIHSRRIGVSAAFFVELEFQDSGYYVYRFYKASFGRQPNYAEFTADRSKVIGGSSLEEMKQAFADEWVQRPAFRDAYPITMSNTEVVNKLFDSAGLTTSIYDTQRQQEIQSLNAGRSRALILRDVIEIPDFKIIPDPNNARYAEIKQTSQYNPAFVLMQYFGYLRRNVDKKQLPRHGLFVYHQRGVSTAIQHGGDPQ